MFNALYQSDRRMHSRTVCDLPICLDEFSGHVRNFGKGGALIEAAGKNSARVGQEIFMTVPFRGRSNDLILKARVAWTHGDCLGVSFDNE